MQSPQSRQKSYADLRRRKLEFGVGEHVFLRHAQPNFLFIKLGVFAVQFGAQIDPNYKF